MTNQQDIAEQEYIEKCQLEQRYGKKVQTAYEMFIAEYIETRKIQLLTEYCNAPVRNSTAIFENKYNLDALMQLEQNIRFLISEGEAATLKLNELNKGE